MKKNLKRYLIAAHVVCSERQREYLYIYLKFVDSGTDCVFILRMFELLDSNSFCFCFFSFLKLCGWVKQNEEAVWWIEFT